MATLREVMAKDPAATAPDATVAEAAAIMVRGRVGSLLVAEADSVVGIITERDILRAAGTDGDLLSTKVRDWMTREPTTAPADQDTEDAIVTMLDSGFRHLPVMDQDELVGIVSLRDLLGARVAGGRQRRVVQEPVPVTDTATKDTAPADIPASDTRAADPAPETTPSTVQHRRERMFEATRQLQERSRPPEGDEDKWRQRLADALDLVRDVVAGHVAETEGDGGFFEELITESGGRLSAAVRRLRRDHERSTEMVRQLREAVDSGTDPAALRQAADELFAQLEAHRHRGSDLLWQAYGVEIGGGD